MTFHFLPVIFITDGVPISCQPRLCVARMFMGRRLIATLLLLILSRAGAFPQALAVGPTASGSDGLHLAGAVPPCHHATVNPGFEILVPASPADSPCDRQHSCCMRRVPLNAPNLPSTNGLRRMAARESRAPDLSKELESSAGARPAHEKDLLSYAVFSTVLRI
jgi:hypothetical protein